jgi:hypothetical protein
LTAISTPRRLGFAGPLADPTYRARLAEVHRRLEV